MAIAVITSKISVQLTYKEVVRYSCREVDLCHEDGRENTLETLQKFVFEQVREAVGADELTPGNTLEIAFKIDV